MSYHFRSLWLSDVHLGTAAARADDLLAFLDTVSASRMYLTGDIIDLERMKVRPHFPLLHRELLSRFLQLAANGTQTTYVPGNHDHEFRQLAGTAILNVDVRQEAEHVTADGTRLLVIHGDCLDPLIRRGTSLEKFGAAAYGWLVDADAGINRLCQRLGRNSLSLASRIKMRLKSANEYIDRFEETAARYARMRGFDGVVCGHIHRPGIRDIGGVRYANDGDWVEHGTAVAEDWDGRLRLLNWHGGKLTIEDANDEKSLAA